MPSKTKHIPAYRSPWEFVPTSYEKVENKRQQHKAMRRRQIIILGHIAKEMLITAGVIATAATTAAIAAALIFPPGPHYKPYQLREPISNALPAGIASIGAPILGYTSQNCKFESVQSSCIPMDQVQPISGNNVTGYASIDYINVMCDLTAKGTSLVLGQNLASLQLNTFFQIEVANLSTNDPAQMLDFWVQNVAEFNTSNHTLSFSSNLSPWDSYKSYQNSWNTFTSDVSNSTVKGKGNVQGSQAKAYYEYDSSSMSYYNGVQIVLSVTSHDTKKGSQLQFSYIVKNPGQKAVESAFDTVRFEIPSGMNTWVSGITTGNFFVPLGLDPSFNGQNTTNLVFAGPGDGEIAMFGKTKVQQMALYSNEGGYYMPLNAIATSESIENGDTGESSLGLSVKIPRGSYAQATSGSNIQQCSDCVLLNTEKVPLLLSKRQ